MKNNVMLDVETLSTGYLPVITQISAVQFDIETGKTFKEFNVFIDIVSCLKEGLSIEEKTLKFWNKQDSQVRNKVLFNGEREEIRGALIDFNRFLSDCGPEVQLWGKGPSFDCAKLGNVCDHLDVERMWNYWNERCVRTMIMLSPIVKDLPFEGDVHDGLDDAKHQIKQVCEVYSNMNRIENSDWFGVDKKQESHWERVGNTLEKELIERTAKGERVWMLTKDGVRDVTDEPITAADLKSTGYPEKAQFTNDGKGTLNTNNGLKYTGVSTNVEE